MTQTYRVRNDMRENNMDSGLILKLVQAMRRACPFVLIPLSGPATVIETGPRGINTKVFSELICKH